MSRSEVNAAIAKFVAMVRMERFYQTSELRDNPLSLVFTVVDRLAVCRRLRQSPPFPQEFLTKVLDDTLVTYLYLTCFDRLGQPADWLDFGAWMESSKHKAERDAILQQAQSRRFEDGMRFVYREYNLLYGVRSSFFRFLRGLPPDFRRELLGSIEMWISSYQPNLTGREASDEEKERYLFNRRNDYTHRADFRPPIGEWFAPSMGTPVQEYRASDWTSTQTIGWLDILERAVRIGLAGYLTAFS